MIDNLSPDLQKAVKILAENLTPILDEIHATAPSSKNYYADYYNILITYEPKYKKLLAIAMLYSGANLDGIEDALKLI